MFNLAGKTDCDWYIRRELDRARVPTITGERSTAEVATTLTGQLGEFKFRRAWTYWVVDGRVPLTVAQELYADPVGVADIRVNGNCTCPAPDGCQIAWFDSDNTPLLRLAEKEECERFLKSNSGSIRQTARKILDENRFTDHPETIGLAFVESYHIDSEVGLRIFVDAIRKHELDQPTGAP